MRNPKLGKGNIHMTINFELLDIRKKKCKAFSGY